MQIMEIDLANLPHSEKAQDVVLVGLMCMQLKALLDRRSARELLDGVTELAKEHGVTADALRKSMLGSLASTLMTMIALIESEEVKAEIEGVIPKEVFDLLGAKAAGRA